MRFNLALLSTALLTLISASPFSSPDSSSTSLEKRNTSSSGIEYLGSVGRTLSGGTKFGNLVFVSGQVPLINGTVVPGGIRNETALVIERVGEVLKAGGTDWSKVLKVTVLLQGQSRISPDLMGSPFWANLI